MIKDNLIQDGHKLEGICFNAKHDALYELSLSDIKTKPDYYFLSNDIVNIKKNKGLRKDSVVFFGVANPHFYHVLSEVSFLVNDFKRIIAIDNTPSQIIHFASIRDTLLKSNNRIEFLQKFFNVKFNSNAVEVLQKFTHHNKNYIHGSINNEKLHQIEKYLWDNLSFDEKLFARNYCLPIKKTNKGLLVEAETIGDVTHYYATLIDCSTDKYDSHGFTVAYGSGFLRNEQIFEQIKNILRTTPIYIIYSDIALIFRNILMKNRYHPMVFWASNLLCDYFIEKHNGLKNILLDLNKYGRQVEPQLPECDIVVIQDERTKIELPPELNNTNKRIRNWSIHTNSFHKVCKYLNGNNSLEVVNVEQWITEDKGISKLPNTKYILVKDFWGTQTEYSSIFLHILIGHGVSKEVFVKIFEKAAQLTNNLMVLEHNKKSPDFRRKNIGVSLSELRDMFGIESILEYCPGVKSNNRNILAIYKS